MVDALRASSTITVALDKFKEIYPTVALDKFKEIYPVYTPEEAIEIAEMKDAVLAGERTGRTIEGFELGNSPGEMKEYDSSMQKPVQRQHASLQENILKWLWEDSKEPLQ